jgi:hypothetical protein
LNDCTIETCRARLESSHESKKNVPVSRMIGQRPEAPVAGVVAQRRRVTERQIIEAETRPDQKGIDTLLEESQRVRLSWVRSVDVGR